ncbi:MAG: hypothetical protein ACF8XB_12885 [Planctomycetota bacterium JB042]
MAREEDRVWYEAIRRLARPPAADPLSPREAREEYRGSPEEPPVPQLHPRSNASSDVRATSPSGSKPHPPKEDPMLDASLPLPLPFDSPAPRARRRRPAPALPSSRSLVAAAALLGAIGAVFLWPRPSPGPARGPETPVAAVAPAAVDESAGGVDPVSPAPTGEGASSPDGETTKPLPTDSAKPEKTPKPEAGTKAKQKQKGAPKGKGATLALLPIVRLSDGGFRVGEEELTAEQAELRFQELDSPYHTRGPHVTLYTTNGVEFGERMLVTAEAAYRRAHQFFGKAPDGGLHVYVTRGTDQYNVLGGQLGGDEKSSAFYAFSTPWLGGEGEWMEGEKEFPFDLLAVTQFSQAESLTDVYVTHATVEQFVRRLVGPDAADPAPRWFVDGVACYLGRWQKPNLAPWSRDRLLSLGGAPALKSFFRKYTPTEGNVLAAGAVVRFLKGDECPEAAREAFSAAIVAVNDGRRVSKSFRRLEKELAGGDDRFLDSLER